MPQALTITVAVVGGLLVLLLAIQFALALVRREGRLLLAARYGTALDGVVRSDSSASFFGLSSRGLAQVRGNGVLALARDGLWFRLLLPRREFEVPLADVIEVDSPRSHLGRTVGRRLLRVRFRTAGGEDSIAWCVADLDGWIADLGRAVDLARRGGPAPHASGSRGRPSA